VASLKLGWAAREDAAAHVFVEESLSAELTITGADAHHLARVRRLRCGERVTAADGTGRWRPYRVTSESGASMTLERDGSMRMEPTLEPRLSVAFTLTKGEKPETVVARLTELGVDEIMPITSRRSLVRWDAARAQTATERFERVAREAAMQCRRARLPSVRDPMAMEQLAGTPGLVLAHPGGEPAGDVPLPGPGGWLLVVGPEGGWAEEELELLQAAPRLAVGPYVLRAETAAVAAAAALAGRRRPPDGAAAPSGTQRTSRGVHGGWANGGKS
jgi:16S rRNA (uracil1498-N3)-methyltransferase